MVRKQKFIGYTFDFLENYKNLILKLDCLIFLSESISNNYYINKV